MYLFCYIYTPSGFVILDVLDNDDLQNISLAMIFIVCVCVCVSQFMFIEVFFKTKQYIVLKCLQTKYFKSYWLSKF